MGESRRALLGAMLGVAAVSRAMANASPGPAASGLPPPGPLALLLSRTSFGIREDQWQHASRVGYDQFLDEQINPEGIDDHTLEAHLAMAFPSLGLGARALIDYTRAADRMFLALEELRGATLLRQAASNRQLFEVMVEFWSNHFSVDQREGPIRFYKTVEDREVIRRHALGNFGDLLRADAKSPAMLYYLDTYSNVAGGPNENYARELLELHTLGVDGGYSEQDVKEAARAFTGWGIGITDPITRAIGFVFRPENHDRGAKKILGTAFPAGRGVEDGEQVLDLLTAHPATANFIAAKLVRRFVSDTPPAELVAEVAATYIESSGDIRSMLHTIFASDQFKSSNDQKFKRPAEFVASAQRALGAGHSGEGLRRVAAELAALGQLPFAWPAPNGYPDAASYWISTSSLLARWNFAMALADRALGPGLAYEPASLITGARTPEQLVDRLSMRILRRSLAESDRNLLIAFAADGAQPNRPLAGTDVTQRARAVIGVLLSSAYFQFR